MRGWAWLWVLAVLLGCDGVAPALTPDAMPLRDALLVPDLALVDAAVEPGGSGAPCTTSAECLSGFCVRDGSGSRVCTTLCDDDGDCESGWICGRVNNAGADVTFICLPDEGPCPGVDTQVDPAHCGGCDQPCVYPQAEGLCAAGACGLGPCLAGFFDLDGAVETGCEYACTVTRGGVEACDTIDNDCDGAVDEGFDVGTDVAHCGACGQGCDLAQAEAGCEGGACVVAECAPGFVDADGLAENGCEAGACTPSGPERCNGVDDTCDGVVDEGFDLTGDPAHCGGCGQACVVAGAVPGCVEGACSLEACQPNFHDLDEAPENGCEYACVGRGAEACNGVDDDCDGRTDEAFDLAEDPTHCGQCGRDCARPGALTRCAAGICGLAGCLAGSVDLDGQYENGCEYACVPLGPEVCNGVDDDCDGAVDEGFDLEADPSHCGRCDRACVFAHAAPACVEGDCAVGDCAEGWVDANGDRGDGCEYACVADGDERCNGLDDDCDGAVDEGFDLRSNPAHCGACDAACGAPNATPICVASACGLGPCAGDWVNADGLPGNGCECAPEGPEVCDGADQDCDGRVDETFDLMGDPQRCGGCDVQCDFAHGEDLCVGGVCRLGACEAPFVDADGVAGNGCECAPAAETCDGSDEDCDGRTDEDFDLQGDPQRCGGCDVQCDFANGEDLCVNGACRLGTCEAPFVNADGVPGNGCECAPAGETCDGVDEDCDGRTDEDFDFENDGANCGGCGLDCLRPNAWTHCERAGCSLRFCDEGFVDANRRLDDGCEVECAVNGAGVPECEGAAAFEGRWDLLPDPIYSCFDILGGEAFAFHTPVTQFSTAGGTLSAGGFLAPLSQRPVPAGQEFEVRGSRGGGEFDCMETYVLRGTFQDADRWTGNLELTFEGVACGFTDCSNQLFVLEGRRLPPQ